MPVPEVVVVDASALAAATFGETKAEEAATQLRGRSLVAPGLLWYEMTEVARAKCRLRPHETRAILERLSEAHRLPIVLRTPDWVALPAFALETGLTTYDAAYLWLSRTLGVPLVTFDRRLGEAARRFGTS